MSALSEALLAAQRSALAALGKAYVGSPRTDDELDAEKDTLREALGQIGCTDSVEQRQWIASLDVLRATGAAAPSETKPAAEKSPPEIEPASDRQWGFIRQLCREKNLAEPDAVLTKATASQVIEQLQAGTYNPADWYTPF